MSHITLWLSRCQHVYTNRERREEGNRFSAALTRTLTAASSPYITAQADWREKPFGFITALETVGAGSEPTLLATATLMSWLNIQVGIWRKCLSTLQNLFLTRFLIIYQDRNNL